MAGIALSKIDTVCREQEVCRLRWDWEVDIPELNTSVFIVPGRLVKNGEDRLVVLKEVDTCVINGLLGVGLELVVTQPLAVDSIHLDVVATELLNS